MVDHARLWAHAAFVARHVGILCFPSRKNDIRSSNQDRQGKWYEVMWHCASLGAPIHLWKAFARFFTVRAWCICQPPVVLVQVHATCWFYGLYRVYNFDIQIQLYNVTRMLWSCLRICSDAFKHLLYMWTVVWLCLVCHRVKPPPGLRLEVVKESCLCLDSNLNFLEPNQ